MWYLNNIPKIVHFYFGGKYFSYLRYLSIYTFFKYNPDWTIYYYYPKNFTENTSWSTYEHKHRLENTDFSNKLYNLPIVFKEIDFNKLGIDEKLSEVHKSDFLRLHLLSTVGGLWSDTDILYHKSINSLQINTIENYRTTTGLCINSAKHHTCCHYVGFIFGNIDNVVFKNLFDEAKGCFDKTKYQSIGNTMYSRVFSSIEIVQQKFTDVINIPIKAVYPFDSKDIDKIYSESNYEYDLSSSIGLHWYGGHPLSVQFLNKTDGGRINLSNNIIGKLINEI